MIRQAPTRWLLFVLMLGSMHVPAASAAELLVVFLVRHGEKADASKDPQLSSAGEERAKILADTLRDSEIKHVHSSDFIRTRDTAQPTATRLGLKTRLYNPRDLPALVRHLKNVGGRHLVVGHGNTTPKAVELLGGKPGSPIHESAEHDRLYVVTVEADGKSSTLLLRYGKPYTKAKR